MGSLIPLARRTELTPSQQGPLATAPHQFDLVLDDLRLRGMTQGERCRALRTLAHLLLEAAGMAVREAGDDHE
jgi:CheY-like chemotaxis protein